MSPKDIVEWAVHQAECVKHPVSVLLADINNVSGVTQFLKEALLHSQIQARVGVEVRNGDETLYLLMAESQEGFAAINRFLSEHQLAQLPYPIHPPAMPHVCCIYPYYKVSALKIRDLSRGAMIAVTHRDVRKLSLSAWKHHPEKLLAYHRATLRHPDDLKTHTLLRCIAHNCLISKLKPMSTAFAHDILVPWNDLYRAFEGYPQLLHQAQALIERSGWSFAFHIPQNKKTYTGDANEDFRLMRELALEGMKYRYPKYTNVVTDRMEKELKAIYELGFTSYFLINWDICRFAREKGFFHVGRGSGANSIVAYCLKITDVDPIDLDLYFERFINPFRSSPPDFDLDFSWQDRDTVTAYILDTYGSTHAALLATYNTFQNHAVVRELGKVYGLPKAEIDALLEQPSYYAPKHFEAFTPHKQDLYSTPGIGHRIRNRTLGHNAFHGITTEVNDKETLYQELLLHAHKIHDLPNYRSLHVGGILISEKPIYHFSALDLPPKGFPSVQFSMLEAEDLGLAKFDILSQRGLGHIKDAVIYIQRNQGISVDIHHVQDFKNDAKIAQMIARGHTMGCFYVESPAMRQLLRKLRCKDYLTLVAASSVIRPGVARSGMMRSFIERHIDPKKRQEAHPTMQQIMPETYGIMVYQEDVIRVAHEFAGLGLAESDILRRGMSGKFRSKAEFEKVKSQFFKQAAEKKHPKALIEEVWHQIESFAGYSFAKGHSASYAVESYQSLFLKTYFPLEFYTAVINNFGGFYKTEFYVHAARMCGAQIEAPCVQNSIALTRIEGKTLWLGLGLVHGLESPLICRLVQEREQEPFEDLTQFKMRCEPGLEQLKTLIRIGALRFTGKTRKALLWEAHALYSNRKNATKGLTLFTEKPKTYALPSLEDHPLEQAVDEQELLGFSLCSPFHLVKPDTIPISSVRSRHFQNLLGKSIYIEGYLVTVKPTRTAQGKEMNFGTWLDTDGYFFDTVHFPPVLTKYPFKGRGIYRVWGRIVEDFGVLAVEVAKLEKLDRIIPIS